MKKTLKALLTNRRTPRINASYLISLLISVLLALAVGAGIMMLSGHNPIDGYAAMLSGALSSRRAIGDTLAKTATLCLTGLATAVAAQAGIFNVGGEGQLYFGAMASAILGAALTGVSPIIAIPLCLLAAMAAGGLWAFIPGWLKVKLKVNEVITTIMMNTIAIYLCAYLSNGPWKTSHPNRVSGTDALNSEFLFPKLIRGSNLTTAIFASAIIAFLVWYVMSKTTTGYEMKLIGENPRFARYAGLHSDKLTILAMTASGMICGLVGMFEVYGLKGNYQNGISNEYYFDGLLVAMIMRYQPVGIIFMSFGFAFLKVGAQGMELNAGVPGELYRIIQAVIIFFMAAQNGVLEIAKSHMAKGKAQKEGVKHG